MFVSNVPFDLLFVLSDSASWIRGSNVTESILVGSLMWSSNIERTHICNIASKNVTQFPFHCSSPDSPVKVTENNYIPMTFCNPYVFSECAITINIRAIHVKVRRVAPIIVIVRTEDIITLNRVPGGSNSIVLVRTRNLFVDHYKMHNLRNNMAINSWFCWCRSISKEQ